MKEGTFIRRASHAPHRLQIALAILFAFVLCTASALAQSTAFTFVSPYTGLDADQSKVLNYVTSQPRLGDVQHVAWASESLFDNNGKITVTLPGENGGQPISFEVLGSHFANETDYAVFGRSSLGEIAVYVTSQGKGGSITLLNSTYVLYPMGGTKGALIKTNPSQGEGGTCATDQAPPEELGYCEESCGNDVLDVLAMITPDAQQWLNDNYGIFGLWFLFVETNNINGALINSNISGKRVRVNIIPYAPEFAWTGSIGGDLNNFRNSIVAQQLAQQNGADIRVIINNQNYGGIAGAIPSDQLDPATTNKVAIARVTFIGPIRYTFAHELAHHFGCWHSSPLMSGCRNGKNLLNSKNTIMANAGNNTRIQHFSNPDVFFNGESTGELTIRDNAAQIRGALCEVANNNSPVWFSVDYEHEPLPNIHPNCPFAASASVTPGMQEIWGNLWNCAGPYTYQWAWSTNNVTYTNIGTNSPNLNLPSPPACPVFYLRLTISTPIGCSVSSTKMFVCTSGLCIRSSNQQNEVQEITIGQNQIVPNPANDRIAVKLEGFSSVSKVVATSTNGTATNNLPVVGYNGEVLTCDVSGLPTGIWFVNIISSEKRKVFKLAIVR